MLDLNRTPRRGLTEEAESLFEAVDGAGDSCDLKGAWYNQHGSELILNQTEDGKLTGEFRTGVKFQGQENVERSNFAPVRGHIFGRIFTSTCSGGRRMPLRLGPVSVNETATSAGSEVIAISCTLPG